MSQYDDAYRETPALFGHEPSPLLVRFAQQIPARRRVLDVGLGQGRNALPLARQGFAVTGIDPSSEAIATTRQSAEAEALALELHASDVFSWQAEEGAFDAVLVFGLIQILSREQIDALFLRLRAWLAPGGLLLLTGWHVGDPSYGQISATWEPIGEHSFRRHDGELRTFLAPDEILMLAEGFTPLHHDEGLGPWHRHGEGERERHGDIELVARRR